MNMVMLIGGLHLPHTRLLRNVSKLGSGYVRLKSGTAEGERSGPRLYVTPRVALLDAKTRFRVEGLAPASPVTLKAEMIEDRGKLLHSNGHYLADEKGVVDTAFSESIGGSYDGVFPSGLLSVLKVASGSYEYGRIHKTIMTTPSKIKISVQDGHIPVTAEGDELDSVELERHLMREGVQRIPVKTGRVRGVLYFPEGDGPFPGVVDMFGAAGVLNETRAALNASRGIASLSLAYFNYDDIPAEKLMNLDLEYFEEATEFLLSQPKVKSGGCGVIGNCAGGFIAYMMGLHLENVKAVFLINAPVNSYLGEITYKGNVIAEGVELKEEYFIILEDLSVTPKTSFNKIGTRVPQAFVDKMAKRKNVQYAVAIGDGDPYSFHWGWNYIAREQHAKGLQNIFVKIYPEAGHLIYPPYSAFSSTIYTRSWKEDSEIRGTLLQFGGKPYPSVIMQEHTWIDMFSFIKYNI